MQLCRSLVCSGFPDSGSANFLHTKALRDVGDSRGFTVACGAVSTHLSGHCRYRRGGADGRALLRVLASRWSPGQPSPQDRCPPATEDPLAVCTQVETPCLLLGLSLTSDSQRWGFLGHAEAAGTWPRWLRGRELHAVLGPAVLAQSPGELLLLTLTPVSPEARCCLVLRQEMGRDLCGWHS